MSEQQTQDYWPCKVEKVPGEGSTVSFTIWTKGLFPVIVAALEHEHPAIDYTQRMKDGKLWVILGETSNIITSGETWQQIIRMHVLKQDPKLLTHLRFESDSIWFLASSPRIIYAQRLASLVHELMDQPDQLRDILKALGKQDILSLIPVHNLPDGSIGVIHP